MNDQTWFDLLNKLEESHHLDENEWVSFIDNRTPERYEELRQRAERIRLSIFDNKVFTRGLIEVSNYCKNNCLYCGIRAGNRNVDRYRLTKENILACADTGYQLGFRTFVMQGGEDNHFTDEMLVDLISDLKAAHPDCAITLSLGERSKESYQKLYDAGADRYLLRHETANANHYAHLHPERMSHEVRLECIKNLKEIGYQTGTGFMVGSPGQTTQNLAQDMLYIEELKPEMVGIGPFISHHDTPFAQEENGTMELTLFMLSCLRLMLPEVLLPSTTALGTIDSTGREKGILAGANVVMPNLSPVDVRKNYNLYDNKIHTDEEAAESWNKLQKRMESIGYTLAVDRGDSPSFK